jgi:RNA polymerase sigma factor for flagellar operon FliA
MQHLVESFKRAMWREYARSHGADLRSCLAKNYLPFVKRVARRVHPRYPAQVQLDDLISAGQFGLLNAIEKFDLSKGNKFETFAARHVHGAMLDYLRDIDVLPRTQRSRLGELVKATEELHNRLGRAPSPEELQKKLGISPAMFQQLLASARRMKTVSLSRPCLSDGGRDLAEHDTIPDKRQKPALQHLQREDLKEYLTQNLSRAERLLIILYYYEGMTMSEIGKTLDLSESRISQMRTGILKDLRDRFQGREREMMRLSA